MKRVIICLMVLCATVSVNGQKKVESLKQWLQQTERGEIEKQKFAGKALSAEEAKVAAELIYARVQQERKEELSKAWQEKKFSWGNYTMRFEYRVFGEKPADGRSLYISMHGGGNTAAAVNDQQWRNQVMLYQPREGVYIAPRAAVDDWNMWFQPHVDFIFDEMIRAAVALMDVNPDKVYIMGYSAGGDGVYRMGPRMADRWAAAAMMAGHPGDVSPLNLRNIGFTLWMGENDGAYNRNKEAVKFGERLDSLHKADPKGYVYETHIVAGKGHWMDRADTVALPWMAKFRRNPYPQKVVWRQDDTPKESFYWLSVPLAEVQKGNTAVVERQGNTFTLLQNDYKTLQIGLNDAMIDFDKPVKVVVDGKVIYNKKVKRKLTEIWNSVNNRQDSRFVFSACLLISENRLVMVN